MQTNPPEPEGFFAIFGAVFLFFVCLIISLSIYYFGQKHNSTALKISAAIPFVLASPIFFVATRMFWIWISYWLLGNR